MEMKYCFSLQRCCDSLISTLTLLSGLASVLYSQLSFKFYWLLVMVLVVVGVRLILYSLLNNWRDNFYFFKSVVYFNFFQNLIL